MATTPYEVAIQAVERLTPEEQRRLRDELEVIGVATTASGTRRAQAYPRAHRTPETQHT